MDYIDEIYAQSAELAKNSYNLITDHIANGINPKDTLEMLTLLSGVIEAQHTAVRELYTILVEAE